jgi:hypothetical protein
MAPSSGGIIPAARVGPRLSAEQLANLQVDASRICTLARTAQNRNSPAAPGLLASCSRLRAANFAKGVFLAEGAPPDPHYRVQLTDAGQAIIATSAQLQAQQAASATPRVFAWAVAVSRGSALPSYVDFLFGPNVGMGNAPISVDPGARAAFLAAMGSLLQKTTLADTEEGIPRAVLIGGGVVVVGALGLLAWKFLL